jgi:hypothetical protein
MQGVLTSRHFLYLVEGEPVVRERLNDWELASRLSYFLWSLTHRLIPPKFFSAKTSGLKAEVKQGEERTFDFDLGK